MINAASYLRVSTIDQTEYSPDAQLSAIKKYCETNNYLLLPENIYIDEGISGRKAEKRPAFMKMISDAKQKPKPFDVILVHKFDRFARNREDSVVYKALLSKEYGIKVISITESIENDKMSIIIESMLEAMAEYYSINLSEEVKKGLHEKLKRGEPLTVAPFGYSIIDKKYIPNETEAPLVKQIFEMYVAGEGFNTIAKWLNNMGIKTHRGNLFEHRTIEYIINNPVYIGKIRWTPNNKIKRNYKHPDTVIIDGNHQALVSDELFNKAVEKASKTKEMWGNRNIKGRDNSEVKHYLVGLLRCSSCGHTLTWANKSFSCSYYNKALCQTSNSIRYHIAETFLINQLKYDFENYKEVFKKISISHETKPTIKENDKAITNQQRKITKLTEAYIEGIVDKENYIDLKNKIEKEIEKIKNQNKDSKKSFDEKDIEEFRNKLVNLYNLIQDENISATVKNKLLKTIIKEIVHNKAENTLYINYLI